MIRFRGRNDVLRLPVPLTDAVALRAEASSDPAAGLPAFLDAVADEAAVRGVGESECAEQRGTYVKFTVSDYERLLACTSIAQSGFEWRGAR